MKKIEILLTSQIIKILIYSIDNKQISLGFTQIENKNFLNFNLLFAGNTIYDDNRTYFAENSLKIGNINILANKSDLLLNKIDFYEMTSYLPVNQTISPLSTEFGYHIIVNSIIYI